MGFLVVRVGNAQYGTARAPGRVLVVVRVGNAQYGTARAPGRFLVAKIWDWGGGVKGKKLCF